MGMSPLWRVRPDGIDVMGRVDPLSSEECYIITADTATRVGFNAILWLIASPQSKNVIGFDACPSSQGVT